MHVRTAKPTHGRLRRTLADIELALCKLHHIQFDAPWKNVRSTRSGKPI